MTYTEIVLAIRETMDEIDLIRKLPAWHAEVQDKIIHSLNKKLEEKLKDYHRLLTITEPAE